MTGAADRFRRTDPVAGIMKNGIDDIAGMDRTEP
jgi:hypothetical protein